MRKEFIADVTEREVRVAVMEDDDLVEILIEPRGQERLVGNIYKGKVENVLPGMQAAFVDVGLDKNAFLYVGDIADGSVVLIDLKNALNTTGLTMTFTDKGEGTIPFEFHAHQDSVNDTDTAPFTVKYFKD